ncbi:MAG TPA: carboxypeptidase-like regulatory domain-containing protein [Terriglobales bacterium]|nr:carboxypeptidase-like regulatory domain-containing protein [Terriglobales bacterium]
MKRQTVLALTLMLSLAVMAAAADPYYEKDKDTSRTLVGRVTNQHDDPLPNAVVYLSNTRTNVVKSYIVPQDGSYRFPALSPNIDYEVYAQFNGRKSDTKSVSHFDSRQQVNINLHIDTK